VCAASPGLLAAGVLRAQPEWYALLLSKELVGDRPLRATVSPESGERRRRRAAESSGCAARRDRRRRAPWSCACRCRAARGRPLQSGDGSVADGTVARRDRRRPAWGCNGRTQRRLAWTGTTRTAPRSSRRDRHRRLARQRHARHGRVTGATPDMVMSELGLYPSLGCIELGLSELGLSIRKVSPDSD
jgi:hypothetical protein